MPNLTLPRRFLFCLLFPLGYCWSGFAQPANKYVTNSVVPAPNAGALGKYGDIPVSYFTGVPDISIPFYTVQEGPLSLPVSINYTRRKVVCEK